VQIHFAPSVRPLDTDEAVRVLADHERRNQKWPVRPAPNWIWPGQQVDGLSLPESRAGSRAQRFGGPAGDGDGGRR
jgi:hypothetical protein